MTQCPACLPPANQGCATCGGTWEVAESVAAEFLAAKAELDAALILASQIREAITDAVSVAELKSRVGALLA